MNINEICTKNNMLIMGHLPSKYEGHRPLGFWLSGYEPFLITRAKGYEIPCLLNQFQTDFGHKFFLLFDLCWPQMTFELTHIPHRPSDHYGLSPPKYENDRTLHHLLSDYKPFLIKWLCSFNIWIINEMQ